MKKMCVTKRILSVLSVLIFFLISLSVASFAEDSENTVLTVSVSEESITLKSGASKTIVVTVPMEIETIYWDTSNSDICFGEWDDWISEDQIPLKIIANSVGMAIIEITGDDSEEVLASVEVNVEPSEDDIKILNSVRWITNRRFFYYERGNYYCLQFGLKSDAEEAVAAPMTVDIRIVNKAGEEVYKGTKYINVKDYSTWQQSLGSDRYVATVKIFPNEIIIGSTKEGTVYYTVYQPGYINFGETFESTNELPAVDPLDLCELNISPAFPITVSYISSSGTINSITRIDAINYEFVKKNENEVSLTLRFTGEKTYESKGDNYSSQCRIGWKLYDEEGYVVKSGTCYTSSVEQGEKYKDSEETIYSLTPGKYSLKIINAGT